MAINRYPSDSNAKVAHFEEIDFGFERYPRHTFVWTDDASQNEVRLCSILVETCGKMERFYEAYSRFDIYLDLEVCNGTIETGIDMLMQIENEAFIEHHDWIENAFFHYLQVATGFSVASDAFEELLQYKSKQMLSDIQKERDQREDY